MRLHPLAAALAALTLLAPTLALADKQLNEVVVGDRPDARIKPRLRDEIIATESFDAQAIERSGGGNVNEVLDKNPGISVQVECSICNVRNVLLNNLPGRYTTVLIDGIPIYSSVSSAYGLDSIGVDGLERIEVSRGAGSSLIAPEALSGVVNLITKRPTEAETRATLLGGEYGSLRADGYLARPFEGGAWSLTLHHNEHETVDTDGNDISEYSGFKRNIAGLGLFLDDVGGFRIKARLDAVQEDRGGGAMGYNYSKIKASTSGNPFDFSKGPNGSPNPGGWDAPDGSGFLPYDDGLGGFSEIIFTDRIQGTISAERKLGDGKLRLAAAYARHEQDSYYEKDIYKACETIIHHEDAFID
ncbi:MAG: TonB-dependent receptor, partial [Betaproteobacteria bacterium HGW-Betaproteobacteria-19]